MRIELTMNPVYSVGSLYQSFSVSVDLAAGVRSPCQSPAQRRLEEDAAERVGESVIVSVPDARTGGQLKLAVNQLVTA